MFIKNYKKTNCPFGCVLFNDNSNYLYWENRQATNDEVEIVNYLNNFSKDKRFKILHIGIGNSYIAQYLNCFDSLDGISVANNEIIYANKLNIKNYKCLFLNKLSETAFNNNLFSKYDMIIDVNLKSYSCCNRAFYKMFNEYTKILNYNGSILTGKKGMNWSRLLKPVYRFSLKKLFYKKLKEFDGPESNKLTISECKNLAILNSLKFEELEGTNIIKFTKV